MVILSVPLAPESVNEALRLGAGANVSTVIVLAAEAALRLPATSLCLAVKLCVPSARPVARYVHRPLELAVTVAISVEPS